MPDHVVVARYTIEPIPPSQFDGFSIYLNDHLADNGQPGGVYFQPLPRDASVFAPERAAAFRAALEIAGQARKLGLGRALIAHAEAWALAHAALDWIDLQVLLVNQPAIRLYQRAGFAQTSSMAGLVSECRN